jgi:hypothetical protein
MILHLTLILCFLAGSPPNFGLPTRGGAGGFAEGTSSAEAAMARVDLGFSPGVRWLEILESEPTPTYIKRLSHI